MEFFKREELPEIDPRFLEEISPRAPASRHEFAPKIALEKEEFSGTIYENQDSGDDTPHRFESSPVLLNDVVITVSGNTVMFGNARQQRHEVAGGSSFGFMKIDLSTLYFKNKTAGLTGVTTLIASRRD